MLARSQGLSDKFRMAVLCGACRNTTYPSASLVAPLTRSPAGREASAQERDSFPTSLALSKVKQSTIHPGAHLLGGKLDSAATCYCVSVRDAFDSSRQASAVHLSHEAVVLALHTLRGCRRGRGGRLRRRGGGPVGGRRGGCRLRWRRSSRHGRGLAVGAVAGGSRRSRHMDQAEVRRRAEAGHRTVLHAQ